MNRRFLILMLAGSLLVSLDPADAQTPETVSNASTELSVAIRAVNDVVEAGSPVEVETTFKNESNHRIPYGVSDGLDYTRYDVRDSGGNQPLTRFGRAVILGEGLGPDDYPPTHPDAGVLGPHETVTVRQRIPAKIFDLTKPGTYSIQLREPWRHQSIILSNTITLKVVEGATPYVAPVPQPPISVTIRPAAGSSVFPGGKVSIEVVTKNVSNHWLNERGAVLDNRDLQRFFRVDVQDSQGATPPETDFGRSAGNRGDVPPSHRRTGPPNPLRADKVEPTYNLGEERTQVVSVSDLYDLSKPGQYTIQVRRWDDDTKTWVKSNTITVTVTP